MLERIIGLDVGDKWLGVALSDPMGIIARPLVVLERRDEVSDAETVAKLVNEYRAGKVVIGLPRLLTGHIGSQAEHVQHFAGRIASMTDVPVLFQDERFSTADAQEIMKANRKKKKTFFKERDDAVAAAVILQDFLDENRPASGV
ncbi:Holliday junction resolvase RuvX [Dehalogenimonas etheniformans]|uniref:Putative pre-16S rRNA nuclease n=1 Tax=Dehalogenimonas etheniformans TaxID=1536648 RepID=A0A2P5P776_9CHLR|nr:Holliday junction resolvase RuvX [Dehalogenimonas etheniformans]PPD58135.1 Holliday junction resolvase RuvX [Dehalogenimonas etheniformans]QNT75542.1 Holliday junction resolvase RuvX [Dehalogenimonas etheniformans]